MSSLLTVLEVFALGLIAAGTFVIYKAFLKLEKRVYDLETFVLVERSSQSNNFER